VSPNGVKMDERLTGVAFPRALSAEATRGKKALLLGPLGAGKTHTLLGAAEALRTEAVPSVFLDLFTAASTPEQLLAILADGVAPFMGDEAEALRALAREGASDRHRSGSALIRLLEILAGGAAPRPFVWLVDEVTEIRSLAYFPELGQIEQPFARALGAARGVIATSSYMGLATTLFAGLDPVPMPGLAPGDLAHVPSLRSDAQAVREAIALTNGLPGTLLPLVADLRESRNLMHSLVALLARGGALETACRRRYETLLLRSRGYAVSKRAAEVVARTPGSRLTDLVPAIGRTPGASRQYLRWLVEVGLLIQIKKRYDFADPLLGLWASLYLGRGDWPSESEIERAVASRVARLAESGPTKGGTSSAEAGPRALVAVGPPKRVDRFEETD